MLYNGWMKNAFDIHEKYVVVLWNVILKHKFICNSCGIMFIIMYMNKKNCIYAMMCLNMDYFLLLEEIYNTIILP